MVDGATDVLVAGYQDIETATRDFESLLGLVKGGKVEIEAVILVAHDADGKVTVQRTGDHLGRKGAGWGGGVGFLVGLARRRCWPRWRSARPPAGSSASSPITGSSRVSTTSSGRR